MELSGRERGRGGEGTRLTVNVKSNWDLHRTLSLPSPISMSKVYCMVREEESSQSSSSVFV